MKEQAEQMLRVSMVFTGKEAMGRAAHMDVPTGSGLFQETLAQCGVAQRNVSKGSDVFQETPVECGVVPKTVGNLKQEMNRTADRGLHK